MNRVDLPSGWKIQQVTGQWDIYRSDGKYWGTRPTKEAAIKYAWVAAEADGLTGLADIKRGEK